MESVAELDFFRALNAVFFHAGQVCSAGARLLVEKSIHDEFVAELVKRAKKIKLGNGFHEETQSGPLISAELRTLSACFQLGAFLQANFYIFFNFAAVLS